MQKSGKINFDEYKAIDEEELNKAINEIIARNKGAPFNALMGEAMRRLKGKADANKISEIIKKFSQ